MLFLVEHATLFPFADAITGSEKGPFIDTGIQLYPEPGESTGRRIYLNEDTIREMAAMLGIEHDAEKHKHDVSSAYAEGKLDAIKEGLLDDARNLARLGAALQRRTR